MYGSFECHVAPFVLKGAPSTLQRYIKTVLCGLLIDICSSYLDYVIIYTTKHVADNREKVNMMLERPRSTGLIIDPQIYGFAVKEIKYLGFIISIREGDKVDPDKEEALRSWKVPMSTEEVRIFWGIRKLLL